jgi:hypothetical protein
MATPTVDAPRRPRRWPVVLAVSGAGVVVLAVYIVFGNPSRGGDHYAAALSAWAIATTGSADVSAWAAPQEGLWLFARGDEVVSNRFAGAVLFAVPFYAAASVVTDGFSMWPGIVAASVCAGASAVFMGLALTPLGRRAAIGGAAVFALGSATFAVSADTQWSHAPAQAALAAGVLALTRGRLGLAGLALGLAAAVRPHLVVVAVVVAAWMSWSARSWTPAVRVGVGAIPGVLVLLSYNAVVHGRFSPTNGLERSAADVPWGDSGGGVGLASVPENVAGTLFSPGRGMLALYPVLLVLAWWLPRAWRQATAAERAAAAGALGYLLVQLTLNRYSGGWWFFGSRLTIEPLTLAFPLLVRAWTVMPVRGWRPVAWVLLGWGFVTHVMGGVSSQPETEGGVLDDPWTFYDPWVVATMNGPGWTALVAGVAAVAFVLGSAALTSSWRWVAAARNEAAVAEVDPSDAAG